MVAFEQKVSQPKGTNKFKTASPAELKLATFWMLSRKSEKTYLQVTISDYMTSDFATKALHAHDKVFKVCSPEAYVCFSRPEVGVFPQTVCPH